MSEDSGDGAMEPFLTTESEREEVTRAAPQTDISEPGPPDPPSDTTPPSTVAQTVVADAVEHFQALEDPFAPAPDADALTSSFFDFEYLAEFEEIEGYWVNPPYAYVSIVYDPETEDRRYVVVEPELAPFEAHLRDDVAGMLRETLLNENIDETTDRSAVLDERIRSLLEEYAPDSDAATVHKIRYYLQRDFTGLGKIDPLMYDRRIEDISCDGVGIPVFVYHQEYRDLETNVRYEKEELNSFVIRMAQRSGKHLSVADPMVDTSLPDGSRVQMTLGEEISPRGSNFTIRQFADVPHTPIDLVKWGTFSVEQMAYLWLCIENNMSLVFAGGTASGKTTSMNAVSMFIPRNTKVITIEDTLEITLPHKNWIRGLTRDSTAADGQGKIDMYDLLQAALRQRPEYLLVGEVRTDPEVALSFFQAMATGHTAYTTFHADSVQTVLSRLQNPPLDIPEQMIQELDIVAIQKQIYRDDKRVRRNMTISELAPGERGIARTPIFSWDGETDTFSRENESTNLAEIRRLRGWSEARLQTALDRRERLLTFLVENDVVQYERFMAALNRFRTAGEQFVDRIDAGDVDAETFTRESER
ncbi:type II/IV secretion system ATPase subunit [Haloarcula sp. JP-L23]|uniref:type II/IV secretion system ATPase subunit n=1 Tax=Haloarcula sp. JP-L23 TaxID=2716717 RepID=UPI00140F1923|nr:type II/IV secretion system ATPase subunit [Haloarcula sp. JP-L23]